MKGSKFVLSAAATAGLAATASAQFPAFAGVTGAAPPIATAPVFPASTGIAPQAAVPDGPTIWSKLGISQAQQEFCKQAGCDNVQISQIEQAKYILTALQGDFQAFQWRNHGGLDLDAQYIWWSSENALPAGQLALNFGRIKDPVIDKALSDNRGATDPAVKKQYRAILRELADTVFTREAMLGLVSEIKKTSPNFVPPVDFIETRTAYVKALRPVLEDSP